MEHHKGYVLSSLDECFKKLFSDEQGEADRNKLEATQRFNEFASRLEMRFEELTKVEREIFHAEPETIQRDMKEIQLDFVNRVEGFYQHYYATISAFAMYLNYVAGHDFKRGMPIGGNKDFLEFLGSKYPELKDNLLDIERARDFRARFVDHIQQHTLHDWMTYSFPGKMGEECVIIYFIKKGPEVYHRGFQLNPYVDDFRPPVNYESFYVSPPHKEARKYLFDVFVKVIKSFCKS